MKSLFLFYGLLIFALLMLFQLSKFWLFNTEHANEIFTIIIAIVSIVIGIYFGNKRSAPKQKVLVKAPVELDLSMVKTLNISEREYEVLELISQGFSNKEIGEKLFLSESTIKTHVSNLLLKLDAKRRTQAVNRAKDLNIIA